MDIKELSTFAKYMVCPQSIVNNKDMALDALGLKDFTEYHYRHKSHNYKKDSLYTNKILLDYLKEAILNTTSKDKKPLLLLSDGKDSLSLAVAYAELGISCDTLTLLRRNDSEMMEYIKSITLKIGHQAYFITVDEIVDYITIPTFLDSFHYMDKVVLDQGYLFFLFGIKHFFEKNHFDSKEFEIIDGLGNDEYFGYLMSKDQWRSFRVSMMGLWKMLPKNLKFLKWYIRSPAESHGDLSTLACFFNLSNSYDLNLYFQDIPKSTEREEYLDFRAFSRGSFHDHQCMMGKTDAASKFLGTRCVFPWLDESLANYCFNMEIDTKLDFDHIINKIPLRKLLNETIGWNQEKRGVDLFFDLDIEAFKEKIVEKIVPKDIIDIIQNNRILNKNIKKRAYLELLNFYGYCLSKGLTENEIKEILV